MSRASFNKSGLQPYGEIRMAILDAGVKVFKRVKKIYVNECGPPPLPLRRSLSLEDGSLYMKIVFFGDFIYRTI